MMAEETQPPPSDLSAKQQALNFLFRQPPATVLAIGILCAICYGVWYGLPGIITQIQTGYDKLQAIHTVELKEQRTDLLKTIKDQRDDSRDAVKANTDQIVKAVDRLTEQLDKASVPTK